MKKSVVRILISLIFLSILSMLTSGIQASQNGPDTTPLYQKHTQPTSALWIEPPTTVINVSQVSVGYAFNLTIWANITDTSYAWQARLVFDPTYFNVTKIDYTGQGKSMFFAGHSAVPVTPQIDNTNGFVMLGESLVGIDTVPPRGDSLFWVEFALINTSPANLTVAFQQSDSFVLDPNLNEISIPDINGASVALVGTSPPPPSGRNIVWIDPLNSSFYTNTTSVGDTFYITVWTNTSVPTFAWQVRINFDPSQIIAVGVGYTGGGQSMFFAGHSTVPISPIIDNTQGIIIEGESLLVAADVMPPGGGSLFWVEFQIVAAPPSGGTLSSVFDIANIDTFLLDPDLNTVTLTTFNAFYSYTSLLGVVHDVAVLRVSSVPSQVAPGEIVYINVTVANAGTVVEVFPVTCYYDSSAINTINVVLSPSQTELLFFAWNTTGVLEGTYTISAYASLIPGEVHTSDNTFVDGRVIVARPVQPKPYPVLVKITPRTLNLDSKGRWITVQVRFLGQYYAGDVEESTITLNSTIPAKVHPARAGKCELNMKFDRSEVIEYVRDVQGIKYGSVNLAITGQFSDGTPFRGIATIRVRMPGDANCDGKVDTRDLGAVARMFGEKNYDLNGDQKIDIRDIAAYAQKSSANLPSASKKFGTVSYLDRCDVSEDGTISVVDIGIVARNFGRKYT